MLRASAEPYAHSTRLPAYNVLRPGYSRWDAVVAYRTSLTSDNNHVGMWRSSLLAAKYSFGR